MDIAKLVEAGAIIANSPEGKKLDMPEQFEQDIEFISDQIEGLLDYLGVATDRCEFDEDVKKVLVGLAVMSILENIQEAFKHDLYCVLNMADNIKSKKD